MPIRAWLAAAVCSVALLAGCRGTTVPEGTVVATREVDGVHLSNPRDEALGYLVVDANLLAVLDWIKCNQTTPDCLRLPAHGTAVATYDQIGTGRTGNIAVYVWRVVPGPADVNTTEDVPVILK